MKRSHKKEWPHGVYTHFSIFSWEVCDDCGEDFRREKGFRLVVGPFSNGRGQCIHLCGTCCPSIDAAHRYAITGQYMPKSKPSPPPPPPPKRYPNRKN